MTAATFPLTTTSNPREARRGRAARGDARRSAAAPPPPPDDPEAALLARLRAGDDRAYDELVRAASPRLLATLRRMLRSEDDARDALQETFLAAFRALPRFAGESKLTTWLHRIAVNSALMKLRAKRRRPEESIDELLPRFAEDGHFTADTASEGRLLDDEVDEARRRAAVRRSIDQLPEPHRTVIVLRDVEGLSTEETSQQLGISPDATKMRLHRARQALRTLLERELGTGLAT
jgi:RNA polymerase sigma-70 factor (ECF subfamily)